MQGFFCEDVQACPQVLVCEHVRQVVLVYDGTSGGVDQDSVIRQQLQDLTVHAADSLGRLRGVKTVAGQCVPFKAQKPAGPPKLVAKPSASHGKQTWAEAGVFAAD